MESQQNPLFSAPRVAQEAVSVILPPSTLEPVILAPLTPGQPHRRFESPPQGHTDLGHLLLTPLKGAPASLSHSAHSKIQKILLMLHDAQAREEQPPSDCR